MPGCGHDLPEHSVWHVGHFCTLGLLTCLKKKSYTSSTPRHILQLKMQLLSLAHGSSISSSKATYLRGKLGSR